MHKKNVGQKLAPIINDALCSRSKVKIARPKNKPSLKTYKPTKQF